MPLRQWPDDASCRRQEALYQRPKERASAALECFCLGDMFEIVQNCGDGGKAVFLGSKSELYKWILRKVAGWVARYPRTALGIVIGYVALSVFELIPRG